MDFWESLVASLKRESEAVASETGHGKVYAEITIRAGKPTGKKVGKEATERIED